VDDVLKVDSCPCHAAQFKKRGFVRLAKVEAISHI
jgi:hypothetical protein